MLLFHLKITSKVLIKVKRIDKSVPVVLFFSRDSASGIFESNQ